MNARQADLAVVSVFFAGLAMMMRSVHLTTRMLLVCGVVLAAGIAMSTQQSAGPFTPAFRRALRGVVLLVAAIAGLALYFSYVGSCIIWPALVVLTALTYLSLRVRVFEPPARKGS